MRISGEPAAAREWFAGLLDHVTTAAPWRDGKPLTTLNVALTAAGLRALGVSEEVVGSFAVEFRAGMSARAKVLGDGGPSSPDKWEAGLGTGDAHVLLTINAQETKDHRRALAKMKAAMKGFDGVEVVFQQDAELLEGAREHFGFADGFAQPAIAGATDEKAAGGGIPEKDGRWRALAPGEFVLGYPDEDTLVDRARRLPPAPDDPLGANGTYMVWRKLYQDVALWRRTIARAGERYGDPERLAAKVVGRWPNGAPLSTQPNGPGGEFDAAAPGANDFRYGDDLAGLRCPLGAHIRRSNPRDALGNEGTLSMRHRMIRRGMPVRRAAAAGRRRRRRHRPRPRLRELPGEHRAPVRRRAGAVAVGRQHLRPRPRQGLPARRRAPARRRQDDDPGQAAVLPRAAGEPRHDARRRVPVRAGDDGAARDRGRGGWLMDPQELGGPERVVKVLGAMEKHMNNVTGFKRGHARGVAFRGHVQGDARGGAR